MNDPYIFNFSLAIYVLSMFTVVLIIAYTDENIVSTPKGGTTVIYFLKKLL